TDAMFNGQPELMLEAIRLAEQAIDQDRNCYLAWYILSQSHGWRVFSGWTPDRGASVAAAQRAAEMLMAVAPTTVGPTKRVVGLRFSSATLRVGSPTIVGRTSSTRTTR